MIMEYLTATDSRPVSMLGHCLRAGPEAFMFAFNDSRLFYACLLPRPSECELLEI